MSHPPGPPLPMPLQTLLWVRRPIELMEWCAQRYGRTFTLKLPAFTVMLTSEREAIRTIFAARPDEMHAGRFNRILRSVVGSSSVLLLDGAEHMHRRKLLLPSFHGARMRFYGETMMEIARRVIARWPEDETFALHPHMQEITLDIILRTVFGTEEGPEMTALHDQLTRMLELGGRPTSFVSLIYLSQRPEAEQRLPWRWMLQHRDRADAMLYRQIAARRAQSQQGRQDVLAMLLQARDEQGEGFTDQELRDELMTALAAGHETTATTLAWAVERILSYPQVYRRLCDEVRGLGRDPDPERLAALPYLDATIKEVLRLRPVIPIVGRFLNKPYTLAGYDLPVGDAGGGLHLPRAPRSRRVSRARGVPSRTLPQRPARPGLVAAVRRRHSPLHRRLVRALRDEDRTRHRAQQAASWHSRSGRRRAWSGARSRSGPKAARACACDPWRRDVG